MALRDLTGQGGGADVLGFARRTLGVDVLRVETAEDNSPALEVGKYLTDEVYVGVKQGADPQSTAAGVEVELTPNITLESEMTGRGANKSGVRRSEEHTSELQSLMRISYAVFCLKNTKDTIN